MSWFHWIQAPSFISGLEDTNRCPRFPQDVIRHQVLLLLLLRPTPFHILSPIIDHDCRRDPIIIAVDGPFHRCNNNCNGADWSTVAAALESYVHVPTHSSVAPRLFTHPPLFLPRLIRRWCASNAISRHPAQLELLSIELMWRVCLFIYLFSFFFWFLSSPRGGRLASRLGRCRRMDLWWKERRKGEGEGLSGTDRRSVTAVWLEEPLEHRVEISMETGISAPTLAICI